MKNRFSAILALAFCVLLICSGSVFGANHIINIGSGGFSPDNITIYDGDTVDFYNYTGYSLLTVYHDSGPCWNWIIDIPNNGHTQITLGCGTGTEIYRDSTYGFSGTINISPPSDVPSTSTAGILIAILLISLLIVLPIIKK